jgi:nitroreductase
MQKALEFETLSKEEMLKNSQEFKDTISKRRTVREFSNEKVDYKIIENAIRAAGSAPSGANKQPWHFVVVSNQQTKKLIRIAAEIEEKEFYQNRAPQSWLNDLAVFETNEHKPFLQTAPYLIAVFLERLTIDEAGKKHKNYYMSESVGIACGLMISSLHLSGLATLTHTPSPMRFLNKVLNRPNNEKPYMLVVVGHPAEGATVPMIDKKPFNTICTHIK